MATKQNGDHNNNASNMHGFNRKDDSSKKTKGVSAGMISSVKSNMSGCGKKNMKGM